VIRKTGIVKSIIERVSLKMAKGGPEYSIKGPAIISCSASGISKGAKVSFACMQRKATMKAIKEER